MSHEISFCIYGGQPRKIVHLSSDVSEEERQEMMKWCGKLKAFGAYDEYISAGGISWVDVPTTGGRRLLVRVCATQGRSKDAWYFLGLLLSEADYDAIRDYGNLVGFVESFTLDSLLSNRVSGSKMIANFDQGGTSSDGMPPLFGQSTNSDWTSADWIQTRVKRAQHIEGSQLTIAFNPPKARTEYTALLLSHDFPLPGLRLEPNTETNDNKKSDGEKKKTHLNLSLPAILSLLTVAFAIGYFVRLPTQPSSSLVKTSVIANDKAFFQPMIRLPRASDSSFAFVVEGVEVKPSQISVRSSDGWLQVGTPKRKNNEIVEFPCQIQLSVDQSVNATIAGSLVVSRDGEVVSECLVEIEAAEIAVVVQTDSEVDQLSRIGDGKRLEGVVTARYGVASVTVNDVPVDLKLSSSGTLGTWHLMLKSDAESATFVVLDRNGNRFSTVEQLPRTQSTDKSGVDE